MCVSSHHLFSFIAILTITTYITATIDPISIERSPSSSLDIVDFCHCVEEQVREVEAANPAGFFCLDFNYKLINLFTRLEQLAGPEKSRWQDGLKELAVRLARYHRVNGIRLCYRTLSDLSVAATLIQPFVDSGRLQSLSLTCLFNHR